MRRTLLTFAVLGALGLAGAGAVVGFGLYNVSAQAGHWPGVSWVLHTTFRNSVKLRAPAPSEVPDLTDPDLIALGAGHYASACATCHAGPDTHRTATMAAMVPSPPPIERAVQDWEPNHLFWIVQNGIKMSGMPPWPAKDRDDEVWAVVAYLAAVQEDSAPDLTLDPESAQAYCATCHGPVDGQVPRLDIHPPEYIEEQLTAYLSRQRPSGIMAQAATEVAPEDYAALAAHFASAADDAPPASDPDLVAAGEALAAQGTRDVPACLACHAPVEGPAKGPNLDGQHAEFTEVQLKLWRDEVLTDSALMSAAARDLTDADIAALAAYFASR